MAHIDRGLVMAKRKTTKRKQTPKPYNGGQWTEARMKSFIISQLRRARWPQKYECVNAAYIGPGTNPKTGHKCKLHRCEMCGGQFARGDMQADHIEPVVPLDGWGATKSFLGINWNEYLQRMFCEAKGFRALDRWCHESVTAEQRAERKKNR
jgi:hypothetical protein